MNRAKEVNRLFLFMVLVSIASPFLLGAFLPELTIYQSISISQTIFLVPVIIYVICTRGEILGELQINPLKASTVLLVFLLAVLLLPVMTWLNLFSMLFSSNHVASSMVGLSGDSLGRNLMYVAFIPALLEEFIFRGVYFQSYRPAGAWKAALLADFVLDCST